MYNVLIKGDINESTLALIDNAIAQDDNDVMLSIDSLGGSLSCGLLAYDRIRESGKNFYANVIGTCMSSATLFLVACPLANRTASPHATILIHNPLINMGYSSLNDVKNVLGSMEDAKMKLVQIYAERTLMTAEQVSALMDNERELYATDCIEKGLIATTNQLYNKCCNYNKKQAKKIMKKSFLNVLTNKIVRALLNEAYVAEDGTELEISELVVGGTCSADGVFVVDGCTITVENGIIVDLIPAVEEVPAEPETIENEGEGEEVAPETIEEVAETVAEEAEAIVEGEEEIPVEDATAIAEAVKEIVEEILENKYNKYVSIVNKCGGIAKLEKLANVKHENKVFTAEKAKKSNGSRSISELLAMKKK